MTRLKVHSLFFFFALLLLAFAAQFKAGTALGFSPDLLLAVLFAAAACLPLGELTACIAFAVFLLNWPAFYGREVALTVVIPLFLYYFRNTLFRFSRMLNAAAAVLIGLLAFYLAAHPASIAASGKLLAADIALCGIVGAAVAAGFAYFSESTA